jgi:uroporphyrinogen-III synthase
MKKVLYLGTDPSHYVDEKAMIVHFPLIRILPKDFNEFKIQSQFADLCDYTHFLLTSKHAVHIFMQALRAYGFSLESLADKKFLAIGPSTAEALKFYTVNHIQQPKTATQEGMMDLLDQLECEQAYFFYPRSSKARPVLSYYLRVRKLRHQVCDLYDTLDQEGALLPPLDKFDEIVFTSPSTVEAFYKLDTKIPEHIAIKAIGPITKSSLEKYIDKEILF